ncbi:uncharacterized protein zgc:100997 isoform X2 [Anabas testudineus]|nr:uncharacterized protein zgc:100997 isoform X2 [Anabas testudineus]
MALLEELSGCKLLYRFRSSSHRIFRLNNISKALAFLDDRHVKLLGIDASSIADGIPSAVLNLVWNIILYFQVKEVTGSLERHLSSSLSSLSMSSYPSSSDLSPQPNNTGIYSCYTLPSKGRKVAKDSKYHGKAIKTLLQWVQRCTSTFGVEVHDFGKSWRSGLAFLALIKSVNPDVVDLRESLSREPRENIEQAFMIAHQSLDIPPLLEPEDVTCTSPDEQSIITYVSMFLGHCSDTNEDYTTDNQVPEIQKCASTAYHPQAQAWPKGLVESNEQLLWKRWSRTSPASPCATLFQMNGAARSDRFSSSDDVFSPEHCAGSAAISPLNRKKGRFRSVLQPLSPLDADGARRGTDQGFNRQKVDDFSLSSEEGIYSLSALDSDEEDAYSYILDLNKEVFLPRSQLKSQVPSVEEETAEELNEESKHRESWETLNGSGCKHQEGSVAQNADSDLDSEVRAHRKFVVDKKESSFRHMTNTRAAFDTEPEDESCRREAPEEEKVVRGQSNGYCGEEGKTKHIRVVTHRYDLIEGRVDGAEKTKMFKMAGWQKEVTEDSETCLSVKCSQVNENIEADDKKETNLTFDEGKDRKLDEEEEEEEDDVKGNDRENQQSVNSDCLGVGLNETVDKPVYDVRGTSTTRINREEVQCQDTDDRTNNNEDENKGEHVTGVKSSVGFEAGVTVEQNVSEVKTEKCRFTEKKATTVKHCAESAPKNDTGGGVNMDDGDSSWTSAHREPSQSFSTDRGLLQSLATSCDTTPLELEMLLFSWILLYCCLILPQINL